MYNKIFLDAPSVGAEEKKYLNKAINSGYVSTIGPFVEEFEKRFASYVSAQKAVSMQSGTAAIHMALHALGIKRNDEVMVPVLTFIATVNPIAYVGARPIFVDVDIKTWNIDPKEIKKHITKRTKAIIPVHLYGNPCNMAEIMAIAKEYNLFVIEDATESLGAKYRGEPTGTFGKFGCFSFNGNKIITTGGGGMLIGHDTKKIEHVKFMINQARDNSVEYFHPEVGFNYRMTNIEAAIGLAQLGRLEKLLAKKRMINNIYKKELRKCKQIIFQEEYKYSKSSYWLNCIICKNCKDISILQKNLKEKGIPTRRIFMPLVESIPYKNYKKERFSNAFFIYKNGLSLPSSTLNSEESIYFVCKSIKELLG